MAGQTAGVPEQKRREIDSEVGDGNVCQLNAHLLVIKNQTKVHMMVEVRRVYHEPVLNSGSRSSGRQADCCQCQ